MASVNIPNVGIVNFPDTMSADDISNVIKTQIIPQAAPSGGAIVPGEAVNQAAPLPTVKDYGVGTFLADLGKGVTGSAIRSTAAMPLAAEDQLRSSARDALAGQLQRPEGVAGLAYDLNRIETPQKMLFNKALDAFKAGEAAVGSHVISDMATKMENIFKSDEQIKSEKQAKKQADLVLAQVPHSESLQQLYTFGKEKGKEFSESQSEKVKNAIQNSQATGNVLKAIKDRNLESFSLGKDPSALGYIMQGSEVFGSLLPMLVATVVTKSPTVATGMGYLQSGSEAIDSTRTFIDSKTDEELAASSPYFKEMVASGVDPKQARKVITDRAEESAAQLQGAVGAFGGNITGQLITGAFDKVIDKYAKSRLAKIALGIPAVMAEQGTEEFLEGIASDIGINTEVVKEIGEESFANFLLGAIGGAPIGLYSGATAKTEKQKEAEAAEQARQEELKKANIVTPETAAETAPQVTTSPVVTPGEVDIPEALETPQVATLPQVAPVEQASAPVETKKAEENQPVETTLTPVNVPAAPQALPPGFEHFEEVQPDGSIKAGFRRIKEAAAAEKPAEAAPVESVKSDVNKIGDYVTFNLPTIHYVNNEPKTTTKTVRGEIKEIKPNGEFVVKTQQDGFVTINQSDVSAEKPAAKTQAQINQERQQEKKLSQIDATGIPLVVYYNGLLSGINNSPVATLEKMHGEETKPALEILKANNLVTINPGNKIYILPKGQQLLDEIRQKSSLGKQLNASESEALFAKYIKQIQEAPTEEAATPVEPVAEEVVQEAPQEAAPGQSTYRQNVYEPIANPNPLEQKVIDIYKSIKEANPNANVDEEIVNPNRYHFVEEKPNKKGIKIGDKVYEKGDPIPKTVVTVLEERVKLADENGRGGFSDIELVSDTPVPYDYTYDFGFGPVNVNVNKFLSGKNDWQFSMYGPGASETGFRSALAIPFEGKRGTKEFDDFVERVVKNNAISAKPKAKAPTKEEKIAANKQRQAEKKAAAEPKETKLVGTITEDDFKITEPIMVGLVDAGYEMLALDNEKSYKNNGGESFRSFIKDGVRIAITPQKALAVQIDKPYKGVQTYHGDEDDIVLENIYVEPSKRKTGAASAALKQLIELVDKNKKTLYVEPVQLDKTGMTKEQLSAFYSKFGFKVQNAEDGRVLVREPKKEEAKAVEPKAKPAAPKVKEEAAEESKPVSSEDARNLLVRFNAGQYKVTEEDGKRWFYKDAVRAFLEGDLKAKVPGKDNGYITAEGLEDVQPKAIEKKVAKVKDEFWEQKKALETIAATKDIRFYLNGVLIDTKSNKLVATDGSILAVVNKPNLKDAPKITGDQQVIDRGGALIPDTKFPDYNRVVPQTHAENKTTVNAPKLAAYVRGVQKANRYARGNPKYSQASLIIDGQRYFYNSQYIITMAEFFQKMGYDSFEMSTPVGDGKLYATSKDGKVELVLMPMRVDKADSFTAPYDVNVAKPIKEFKEAPTLSTSNIEPTTQQETLGVVAPLGSAETRTDKEFAEQSEKDREEVIQEYRVARAAGRRILRKVAAEGSNLRMQKELNDLLTNEEALKDYLDLTRPTRNNAVDFMRRATDALADGVIDESVEAFIRDVYEKYPNILEGLRLSIRSRKVDGKDAGNYNPFSRLVTLWTDGSGVDNPKTIRHELMHSLEQMMTPQAKQNLVEAWYKALAKAMKENTDEPSRKYFEAVNEFLNDPSEETMRAAIKVLPSYDLYQYLNPSEFWAVNAEKLMEQKLGTPWNRFVIAVKRLFEGLKNVLGFDNQYAVHKAFNDLIEGKAPRQDKQREMIVDYLTQGKFQPTFLENIRDDQDLVDDLGVNEVPNNDKKTAKEMLAVGWNKLMQFAKELYDDPLNKFTHTLVEASDLATMARIEAIDFAAGVRDRDFAQTKGQIRYANGQFVASLSVKNALHSAHIATQVILRGGLEYSTMYGQFLAVAKDHSIKNIIQLQYDIRKRLGKKLGDQIINTYLIARRTRSIQNEYLTRLAMLENAKQEYEDADPANKPAFALELEEAQDAYDDIVKAYNKIPKEFLQKDQNDEIVLDKITDDAGNVIEELPIIDDDAVDRAIERDTVHPELAEIMTNWTAVNHNMLDNLAFSGRISQKTADALKKIKDYVPWNRVMDEEEGVRGGAKRQRSAGIAKFKKNRTERDVDNVVERMQEFVAARTISSIRSFAENRIAMQYGTRNDKGKLKVFSDEGKSEDGVRLRIYANGRSINIEIKDHLVAEALMGLTATPIEYDFQRILSGSANFFRRSITFTGYFQVKQVFYDAPTAAWISGTRNPFKLFAGCFSGFLKGLNPVSTDPVIDLMKSAGFGGYFGAHRSAKKETKLELGAFTKEGYALVMKFIDKIGDASDTSQRIPTYNQVFAETGDPALALYMASDVMDFSKHGKAKTALFLRSTVTFMQAYATQIDALSQAAIGGNLKGNSRAKAIALFYATYIPLATTCILLAMAAGEDDDYWKLDDETRAKNFYVPYSTRMFGHPVLIPMHSSASLFFKVVPEIALNQLTEYGTKDKMDKRRLRKLLANMAQDTLLGPSPLPTGLKAPTEIVLDHSFFTGTNVTPQNLKKLTAARQYTASTSELGKKLSSWTSIPFTKDKRVLTPIEMDHLIRGQLGTVGALSMWFSNEIFKDQRVAPQAKENPLLGGFVGADVPRKKEDLFYDMKEATDTAYATYMNLATRDRTYEAQQFYKENKDLIAGYGYTSGVDQALKQINAEIRRLGDRPNDLQAVEQEIGRVKEDETMTMSDKAQLLTQLYADRGVIKSNVESLNKRSPESKRAEINRLSEAKNTALQDVERKRRELFGMYEE